MRRWALAGAVVAGVVLLGVVGFAVLLSNAACASLTLRAEPGAFPAVALDEPVVREEAPQLAALLDRAAREGHATEDHERAARAMYDYLMGASGGAHVVGWGGETLRILLAVC